MTPLILVAAGVIGLAVVAIALVRPRIALLALVVLDISNLNGVIANNTGVALYKPELALAAVVLAVVWWRRRLRPQWSPVLLGLSVLFAGFLASLLVTADPAASEALLGDRGNDLVFFLLVYLLMIGTDSIKQVACGAVIVLAAVAGVTILHEFVLHNQGDVWGLSRVPLVQEGGAFTPRHAGTSSDVNFWSRLLILVSPLALSLFAAAKGRWLRLWWIGCALALIGGVYLTQSRGGFIALFVALVTWLAIAGGWYRKALLFLPFVLAVVVPLSGIASRLGTVSTTDLSVATRKRLQLDALAMFLDSPVLGHGIGSYVAIFQQYDRLSDNYQPVTILVAAHNFYLEQAADGGIVLLVAWALFVGTILFAAARARAIALRVGDMTTAWLGLGIIGGIIGWLLASVFLHLSDFRALLVLAALAAAIDVQLRDAVLPAVVAVRRPAPSLRRQTILAGLALAGAAGVAVSLTTGAVSYQSAATLGVVPKADEPSWTTSYQLDIVSRGLVVPTLATVLTSSVSVAQLAQQAGLPVSGNAAVEFAPSDLGGALDITVRAPDRATATVLGASANSLARQRIASLDTVYTLDGQLSEVTSVTPVRRWFSIPSALVTLISGGLLALGWRRRAKLSDGIPRRALPV